MTRNERLTLAISIIALVLSGLSLLDSHENSEIHRSEAAPHLDILSADLTLPTQSDPRSLVVIFHVINSGEIGVKITEADVHPHPYLLPGQEPLRHCYEELGKQDFKAEEPPPYEVKVGPKGKKPGIIGVMIQMPPDCPDTGWSFVGTVDFGGVDDSGHKFDSRKSADVASFRAASEQIIRTISVKSTGTAP